MNSPRSIGLEIDDPQPFSVEDEKFDQIYPAKIRQLSSIFWTPVAVAAEAAKMLVTGPGTRVLDIGCGAGKFCLVGAALTDGRFTGVEQRAELIEAAREAATILSISDVEFLHANVMEIDFADYDAFYLYNPFEENIYAGWKLDHSIPLSPALFKRYTKHVAVSLGKQPIGTRVATYCGYNDELPACYTCESALFQDDLKLWIKTREYDPDFEYLAASVPRSYRGSIGWQSPRKQI